MLSKRRLNRSLSKPGSSPATYSLIVSTAIRITASAQRLDTTENLRSFFSVPRDRLARMKATAVCGTICGCPGRILCKSGKSSVQPSNTMLETKIPKPLTAFGISTKGEPQGSTKSADGLCKVPAPIVLLCGSVTFLEGESHSKLDLATRCGSFGDRSKLRCVYEAIRRAEIRVIESVEGLGTYLKLDLLGDRKLTLQRQIES